MEGMRNKGEAIFKRLSRFLFEPYRSKLARSIIGTVFASLLLIELIILFPSFYRQRSEQVQTLELTILAALRPLLMTAGSPSGESLAAFPQQFHQIFDWFPELKGLMVYSSGGETILSLGERPDLQWEKFSSSQTTRLPDWKNSRIDLAWGPDFFQKELAAVARLDTSELEKGGQAYVWRILALVLLISAVVTITTMCVLNQLVLSPILSLNRRLQAATQNPEHPEPHLISRKRNDELTEVMQAFNQLIRQMSSNIAELKARGNTLQLQHEKLARTVSELRAAKSLTEKTNQELLREITVRRETENALRKAMEDLDLAHRTLRMAHAEIEQLIASIPSVLVFLDKQLRVSRWNKFASKTFGYTAESVLNKEFLSLELSWNNELIRSRLITCKATRTQASVQELHCRLSDKRDAYLMVDILPIIGDQKDSLGYLILAQDLTERKVIEQQLSHAQRMESIGQLASGVAHEINTPTQYTGDNLSFLNDAFFDLCRLLEAYENLKKACFQQQPQSDVLKTIERMEREIELSYLRKEIPDAVLQAKEGVTKIAHIVKAMKEFSLHGSAEKRLFDLNRAIHNTITVSRNEWKYVAEIVTNLDPELPAVCCFPGDLSQAILCILVNAAEAIRETVAKGDKGRITVSSRRMHKQVEIRISDNGGGIPAEIRSCIFDPFFSTKEVGKGVGQGLWIAHSTIVEKHGGSIHFETEEGKGTTFIICLPLDFEGAVQKWSTMSWSNGQTVDKMSLPSG